MTFRYEIEDGKTIKAVYDANGIVNKVESSLPTDRTLYQHYRISTNKPYHFKLTPDDIRCSLLHDWLDFDGEVRIVDDEDGIPIYNYTCKGENCGAVVPYGLFVNENQVVLLDSSLSPLNDIDGEFKSFTVPFHPLPKGYCGVLKFDIRYSLTDNLIEFRRNPLTANTILPIFPTRLVNDYDIVSTNLARRYDRVASSILQQIVARG